MAERTPRIVVVDDDAFMRKLLRLHLSNAGYDVVAAEDAVVAMKCSSSRQPILLSDLISALGALLPAPRGRMRLERGTAGAQPVSLALS